MRKALIVLAGCLLLPASASGAVTVSPEKQAQLNQRGWSAVNNGTSSPVLTAYKDGRACEKGRSGTQINGSDHNPLVKVWTSLQMCARNGQMLSKQVEFGQGSSGAHWVRKTPFQYPWLKHGWVSHSPDAYRSTANVAFSYGGSQTWWYLKASIKGTIRRGNDIVFQRSGHVH